MNTNHFLHNKKYTILIITILLVIGLAVAAYVLVSARSSTNKDPQPAKHVSTETYIKKGQSLEDAGKTNEAIKEYTLAKESCDDKDTSCLQSMDMKLQLLNKIAEQEKTTE